MNLKMRFTFVALLVFLATSSTLGSGRWTQPIPGGQSVRLLVIDPTNSSTLYAGTDGGVMKSTDRGASWQPIVNGLTSLSVFALAIDPADSSTLYAGTFRGGAFRSTDSGANWVEINNGLTSRSVFALAIDPTNPSIVYAGSGGGVFKSTDGGDTWAAIHDGFTIQIGWEPAPPPQEPIYEIQYSRSLAINPTNPSTLYAGTVKGAVFRSTDGGANWVLIKDGFFGHPGLSDNFVETLSIDPTDSSTLYSGSTGGVFRSTDGGDNWTAINSGMTGRLVHELVIDPTDPSTLYAGTDWVNPGSSVGDGVFKSTDGGDNWVAINTGLTNRRVHALAIDPASPSTLYAGTRGGGVFVFVEEPRWLYAAGNPAGIEDQFDGLAFTNFSDSQAYLDLETITSTIAAASLQVHSPQGNANYASMMLPPGEQKALLRTDLFEGDSSQPAWIELTSDIPEIGTFFEFGSDTLSQLDGGVTITETSTDIVLTRVFDGPQAYRGQMATTRVSILNPNQDPVTMELNYRPLTSAAGAQGASTVTRTIPGRSFLDEPVADLFGATSSASPLGEQLSGGLITGKVTEGDGVVAFEVIQLKNQSTVLGLNAATGNSTNRAYSAQLASLPGLFTSINVANLAEEPRNVTLRAVQEDGSNQGDPVALILDPGEQFTEDAGVLFGTAADASFVASLIVEADGDGVVGDVIFGDSTDFAYAASLPLQTQPFTEAVFSQAANVSGFFTGLAFFYPGPTDGGLPQGSQLDAEITIQVFLPSGEMVGERVVTLAAGERISRLVEQLVGKIELAGGYVRISSTQPIIGQMLFGVSGPGGIQLFSAVSPTVVH